MKVFIKHRTNNHGLALFLHQGMLEWLKVWSKCTSSMPFVKDRNEECIDHNLSDNLRTQVVMLLTNMVLDNYQEVEEI
jgi:hypothetical protein